jgi:hypothetical protein
VIPNAKRQLIAFCVVVSNAPMSVNPALGVEAGQGVDVSIATEVALAGRATAIRLKIMARTAIRAIDDRFRVSTDFGTMPFLSSFVDVPSETTGNSRTLDGPEPVPAVLPRAGRSG